MAKKVGRPRKNTVDFFPHIVGDARMIRRLKKHYGKDGYIVYWVTMEALAKSDGHYLDLSDSNDMEDHADDCMVEIEIMNRIFNDLAEWGRIDSELWNRSKMIWCEKFMKEIDHVYVYTRNRPAPKKPQIELEMNFLQENNNLITISRLESRVEESRVEEKGEKKIEKLNLSKSSFDARFKITVHPDEIPNTFPHPAEYYNKGAAPSFEKWYGLYGRDQGRKESQGYWDDMTAHDRQRAYAHSYYYRAATPEVQYRTKPAKYLAARMFEEQIIDNRRDSQKPANNEISGNPNMGKW